MKEIRTFTIEKGLTKEILTKLKKYGVELSLSSMVNGFLQEVLATIRLYESGYLSPELEKIARLGGK